jgi:TolB-like protein
MSDTPQPNPPVSPDEIRAQLDRLLHSQALNGSEQLKRLVRHVVTRTLDGHSDLLKEYNLGLEVFQRPPDYDPKADPIVRVQARRLRSKLDEYYASEGAADPLVIDIPRGAYVPVFIYRNATERLHSPGPDARPKQREHRKVWVAVSAAAAVVVLLTTIWLLSGKAVSSADVDHGIAVLPLQVFADGNSRTYVADQVAEVLTTRLAEHRELKVLSRTTASRYRDAALPLPAIARELGVRWIIEGGVGVQGTHAYIKLRLVDSVTDRKVWADVHDCEVSELTAANAHAADRIAAAVAGELDPARARR